MPNKKITVVGDGAEEPLSPEEEHRIEVRVDQMLDPALPDTKAADPATPVATATFTEPAPAPTHPEKKVTKIVTTFADEPKAETPAPKPTVPPAPEVPNPTPVVRKIAITHDDDEAEKPVTKHSTPAAHKPKKTKKPTTKVAKTTKGSDDNLDSKADAITAAALAAAEQLHGSHTEPADAPVDHNAAPEPELETESETAVANQPEDATAETDSMGAPPLILKHGFAPLGAGLVATTAGEAVPSPKPEGKKISIVDNSGDESESDTAETVTEESPGEPTTPEPAETPDVPDKEVETAETPDEPVANTQPAPAAEPEAEEGKKYRPPDGPIQFKRAEAPLQPLKPGSGPRPDAADDGLSSEDAALTQAFETKESARPKLALGKLFGRGLKVGLFFAIVIVALGAVVAFALPAARNKALGLVGITGDVHITVVDASDGTPLASATITSGGSTGTTLANGVVTLHGVKLGSQNISIKRYAFAGKTQAVNVDWHSQNSSSVKLAATGTHYPFSLVDYLSGQPVANAQLSTGGTFTDTDSKGNATVVASAGNVSVNILAGGYTAAAVAPQATGTTTVKLIPAGQDIYIARASGKFNIYSNTVDGQHEQLVLANASTTATDLAIVPSPDGVMSALVSTRDNTHDASGNLQDSLSLVRTHDGTVTVVDHADTIKLIDWFGSRVVYVLSKTTTSTTDTNRYQLVSYDTASQKRTVLDHAAYLNDVVSAKGTIYYATAANGSSPGQFIGIQPDGTNKKVLLGSEVAAITRVGYTQLALASVNKWYIYNLGDAKPTATSAANSTAGHQYSHSPNAQLSVYIDRSGDTPKLELYNLKTGKESLLAQSAGITYPIHWLGNNTIVYRVSHGGVVTDRAVTTSGGDGQVIANVSDIAGISLWHE